MKGIPDADELYPSCDCVFVTGLLRPQENRAARLRLAVSQLPGVQKAEANTVTGSLKLHYDAKQTTCLQLLDYLRAFGYVTATDQPGQYAVVLIFTSFVLAYASSDARPSAKGCTICRSA